jgi:hypothetical protein
MGDYFLTLQATDVWDPDIMITFRFTTTPDPADDDTPILWPASIDGDLAVWHTTADQIADVRAAKAWFVWLVYVDSSGTPIEWMKGEVNVV